MLFYQAYAEQLASYGFILVQYNGPALCIVPDKYEVRRTWGFLKNVIFTF